MSTCMTASAFLSWRPLGLIPPSVFCLHLSVLVYVQYLSTTQLHWSSCKNAAAMTDRQTNRETDIWLHAKLVDSDWRVINWISKQLKWIRGGSGSDNLPSQSELACCGKTNAPCWWPQPAREYTKLYPTKLLD